MQKYTNDEEEFYKSSKGSNNGRLSPAEETDSDEEKNQLTTQRNTDRNTNLLSERANILPMFKNKVANIDDV